MHEVCVRESSATVVKVVMRRGKRELHEGRARLSKWQDESPVHLVQISLFENEMEVRVELEA